MTDTPGADPRAALPSRPDARQRVGQRRHHRRGQGVRDGCVRRPRAAPPPVDHRAFRRGVVAQYGLLNSFPSLLPFADLGMAAVVINAVAGADNLRTDTYLRNSGPPRPSESCSSPVVVGAAGVTITLLGLWPTLF